MLLGTGQGINMAKFIYRMQSILDIKSKLETQARMDYAAARMALNEEEEKLKALYFRKDGYEREAARLLQDELHVRDILDNQNAILRMDDYIAQQKIQVSFAMQRLEKEREKLQEIMQERKTHEKLKEKAFEEFRLEENAAENKMIDELTSYTYGQKRKAGERHAK